MNLTLLVAAHKPYRMPTDGAYLPVQVGAAGKPSLAGFTRDDDGANISARNASYCELTALYWAWKNLPPEVEAVGLVHYRRHFRGARGVATGAELAAALEGVDALLPKRRHYVIETTYGQYVHAHHAQDLDETRRILVARGKGEEAAFDRVMRARSGHRFNMFVLRRPLFDAYCAWLFEILFALEARLDISAYSPYDARVFGFVGERLLDVWLDLRKPRARELPVLHLESQHWPMKILRFVARKFGFRRKDNG